MQISVEGQVELLRVAERRRDGGEDSLVKRQGDFLIGALEAGFGDGVTWSRPEGGYFVWLDGLSEAGNLLGRAQEAGIAFVAGSAFFPRGSSRGATSARLAFSYETPARIVEGVQLLATLAR